MKILQVNKFHFPKGGADAYYLQLSEALEKAGHDVSHFAMQHPQNLPSSFSQYFAPEVDFLGGVRERTQKMRDMIFSKSAAESFERLVQKVQPDIVHIHNIYHQISPSILRVARKYGAKIVMTVHDFKLICPNYLLFANGSICERCKKHKYYQPLLQKCHKGSLLASAAVALETSVHKIFQIYERNVDIFLAPSNFVKQKLVEFGQDAKKILVVPHGVEIVEGREERFASGGAEPYFLYVGRLHPTKGVDVVISALARISDERVRLKIAGEGISRAFLEKKAEAFGVFGRVDWLGNQTKEQVRSLMLGAQAVVVPSVYYETFSLVTAEALALGKLVVASNLGALPELLRDPETGLLFPAGNAHVLSEKLTWALRNSESVRAIEKKALIFAQKHLSFPLHIQRIEERYRELVKK